MNLLRRKFIKTASFVGGAVAIGSSVLVPQRVIGAYMKAGFEARDVDGAIKGSLGSDQHSASDAIKLKAPDIAENGAVVPITVATSLEGVEAIGIIVTENPSPLVAAFDLTSDSVPEVSTRIKMGKTSDVMAVVKANGKLYSASKNVKVTIGGCGG